MFERVNKAVAQFNQPENVDAGGVLVIEGLGLEARVLRRIRLSRRDRDWPGPNRLALRTFVPQQLLHAAHRIAFLVKEAVDSPGELNVAWTVIAPVAGALHRPQLGKLCFPITQDVLGDSQLLRQFADRL